jgi:hypothetical protein
MGGIAGTILVVLVATLLSPVIPAPRAEAAVAANFDPAYIISDELFYGTSAMSEGEIQNFLDAKIGTCRNALCLNVLRIDTITTTLGFGTCSTYVGAANESAARMIYKVQRACSISAKVLLVTLQKEQGLVTSKAPTESILRKALGQGCPDTAQCDSAYYGFFMQVFSAARQFAWYGNPESSHTSIKVGQTNAVRFHPNAACGSSAVVIRNRATAALYYYTPYQPNTAAMANISGVGDSCSSYGNRNFWVYYSDWFGSPNGGKSPIGDMNVSATTNGDIRVQGWAIDPDTTDSVAVHIYLDGQGAAITQATTPRPDVGALHPDYGSNRGFDVLLAADTGTREVCAYGINVAGGSGNTNLGCRTIAVVNHAPFGDVETSSAPYSGEIAVRGWTIDPDTSAPLEVHVYVDGMSTTSATANIDRPDVARYYPVAGSKHGFQLSFAAKPGTRNVCVYAINQGPGRNALLGCESITVQSLSPFGDMGVTTGEKSFTVSGWAIDPEAGSAIDVHVYVDGVGVGSITANASRPDVEAAFPGWGKNHGYTYTAAAELGEHSICAYAINVGVGANTLLGCETVTVRDHSPFGAVDLSLSTTGVSLTGWAIDPDTTDPIDVHYYVDGRLAKSGSANVSRPDVARAYPGVGNNHGIDVVLPTGPGAHQVCAYGINVGIGTNRLLGCKAITVPGDSPFGAIDLIGTAAGIHVTGWAIDRQSLQPVSVHYYLDGVGVERLPANVYRPDVGRAFPGMGDNRGIAVQVAAGPGAHQLCAYGINIGGGPNALLGCKNVSVPAATVNAPFGAIDLFPAGGGVVVTGWAIDRDTTNPVNVHFYVDGVGSASVSANVNRPDVGRAYPGFGDNHGIEVTLPSGAGTRQVCAYGINVGSGTNALLGCKTVVVPTA